MATQVQKIVVINLATGEEQIYIGVSPKQAVICAYAQSINNFNTWEYDQYYDRIVEGEKTVACGDFSAQKFDTDPASIPADKA
jgi:hypothetical protein